MTIKALDYRCCETHGVQLFHRSQCVSCFPLPEPRIKRVTRKPKPTTYHAGGNSGRPRAIGLTARETAIASLIAHGRTEAEAAVTLGISRNTVASTLGRATVRLGFDTRAELIADVAREVVRAERGATHAQP